MILTAPELLAKINAAKNDIRPLAPDIIATLNTWSHPDNIIRTALTQLRDTPGAWSYDRLRDLGFTAEDMDKIAANFRAGKAEQERRQIR